jgi:hypothetical protein
VQLFQQRVMADLGEEGQSATPSAPRIPLADAVTAVLVVVGAFLVVLALHKAARTFTVGSYDLTFWAGMVLAYLTVAWRALYGPYTVRWLGVLGLFTVLPKFWMSRNGPIYFDESAHYALLRDVISSGHLFQYSPLLPIGTFYPGMESVAATIHWLTGMSAWDSALTLVAVVHSLLLVQMYYIARALSLPHRWAVVAGLVYAVNPSFLYEDVQFAYESVAILLMLTILRLYADAMAVERSEGSTWRQGLLTTLLIAVMSFGCVVTHHLTSLTGVGLLLAGALVFKPQDGFLDRRGSWHRQFVRWTPALILGACFVLWVAFEAPKTVPYLFPHLSQPFSQIASLLKLGHSSGGGVRSLFSNSRAPAFERVAAFAAPVLIALTLLVVVIRWLWKRRFESNFLWSFVLTAAYLVSLPLTLLSGGAAGAHRTWASTWAGVALLPAAVMFLFELRQRKRWVKRAGMVMGTLALVVLLIGNVAAGTPMDYRYPGPYEFGSDTLSLTTEELTFDSWVEEHLGAGAHVVTDRYTALELTDHADAVTPLPVTGLPLEEFWYDKRPPDPALMNTMDQQQDDYLAVDLRDTYFTATEAPLFVTGEPALVPVENMTRLGQWPWLKLIYSSQHYRLYKINFNGYYLWYPFHSKSEG